MKAENTINNFTNLLETCKTKFDMNIIKDKPLIRIKQLTPKFDDSDTEVVQGDYDEEVRKEKQKLKKAVIIIYEKYPLFTPKIGQ